MAAPRLSILCMTRADQSVLIFLHEMEFVASAVGAELMVVIEGELHWAYTLDATRVERGLSLDDAVDRCRGEYLLRLNDHERCSPEMVLWLFEDHFLEAEQWNFPCVEDATETVQTRLSVKSRFKEFGEALAPVAIVCSRVAVAK